MDRSNSIWLVVLVVQACNGCGGSDTLPQSSSPNQQQSATAHLTWETTVFQHQGPITDGQVVAVFPFANNSNREIKITGVVPSFGCRPRPLRQGVVRPGQLGQLQVDVAVGRQSNTIERTVQVHTSENQTPYNLRIVIQVPQIVTVLPKIVTWRPGEPRTKKKVAIQFNHEKPVQIISARPASGLVSAHVNTLQTGKQYEVLLTPNPDGQRGQVAVTIETDLSARLGKQVVYARLMSSPERPAPANPVDEPDDDEPLSMAGQPYRLQPDTLTWRVGDVPESKTVQIVAAADDAAAVKKIILANDHFSTQLTTIKSGQHYALIVTPKDTGAAMIDVIQIQLEGEEEAPQASFGDVPLAAFAVISDE